jgi:Circularly permutated YpsA SLOG family
VKIISGGQTGADRAALDWAIAHGVDHGGWCPKDRRAEDGPIPPHYRLSETPSRDYEQRTEWNVRDSDGTIIFSLALELTGGSRRTAELAARLGKPHLHVRPDEDAVPAIRDFLQRHRIAILNIAGPRASGEPGIAQFVQDTLSAALRGTSGRG